MNGNLVSATKTKMGAILVTSGLVHISQPSSRGFGKAYSEALSKVA